MPFVSFGKTDDQVTRIDVALNVVACKFCGYPDGTVYERERESSYSIQYTIITYLLLVF